MIDNFAEEIKRRLVQQNPELAADLIFTPESERPTLEDMIPLDSIQIPDDCEVVDYE